MQLSPYPHTWREVLLSLIYGTILAIPVYIKLWRDRKKPTIDEGEAEARTELARVSAQSLVIRDGIATGEGVGKMLANLIEAGETISDQSKRIFELEQDNLELEMARLQLKELKGRLDATFAQLERALAQLEKVSKANST